MRISLFLCLTICNSLSAFTHVSVGAESAIIMNANTGGVLFEKNSRLQQFPASTTKVATAAYILDQHISLLDQKVTASKEALKSISGAEKKRSKYARPAYWLEPDGTHIGLKEGESLEVSDLLYGLMLASGNDAANVIAEAACGDVPRFIAALNDYMRGLGALDTNFCNPHGLHHPEHRTTAYDMALLTALALKNSEFRKIVSTVKYRRPKSNMQQGWTIVQSNQLLKTGRFNYPAAIGVKTGYTSAAQRNLVAAATKDGRTLIAVLMKCKERDVLYQDVIALFEAAFNEPMVERLVLRKGVKDYSCMVEGGANPLATYIPMDVTVQYYPSEEPQIDALIHWKDLKLPINKDDAVGEIIVYENNNVTAIVPLLAQADVQATWSHWLWSFMARDQGR